MKRIAIILATIMIGVLVGTTQTNQSNENKERNIGDAVQVSTSPISSKVVVLDAGHGKPDEGAQSKNGITEADINLKITFKLKKLLEEVGCKVILTRSDENAIYDLNSKTLKEKKISDMRNRAKIGNNSSADIFVSIHLNMIEQSKYYGWQTFYKEGKEESERLAKSIQNGLNNSMQKENKRVAMKLDNKYLIKNIEIPISIVECGFLSNPQEEKELQDDVYQENLALGIYNGIIDYFKEWNLLLELYKKSSKVR